MRKAFREEWERLWPVLKPALDYAGHTHDEADLLEAIAAGALQFWPGENSAIVTEIVSYPRFGALRFFLAGGDLAELKTMEPRIIAWARQFGCARVEIGGRRGWRRALQGYTPLCTVLTKPIHSSPRISP
jgi:hypothetical protein